MFARGEAPHEGSENPRGEARPREGSENPRGEAPREGSENPRGEAPREEKLRARRSSARGTTMFARGIRKLMRGTTTFASREEELRAPYGMASSVPSTSVGLKWNGMEWKKELLCSSFFATPCPSGPNLRKNVVYHYHGERGDRAVYSIIVLA